MLLVSPSDWRLAEALDSPTSSAPEKYGSDVLVPTNRGLLGVQRKTVSDLLRSMTDGRLSQSIRKMKPLVFKVCVLEGYPEFTGEGRLILPYATSFTKARLRNVLRSLWYTHGIRTEITADMDDTVDAVRELEKWLNGGRRSTLLRRPKEEAKNRWGQPDQAEFAKYFLQGFPGVGPETADAIYRKFGKIPMAWTCTEAELREVYGIGPLTSKHLVGMLGNRDGVEEFA